MRLIEQCWEVIILVVKKKAMGVHKTLKQKIFQKYSTNLENLFQNWRNVRVELPEGGGYVCPVGFTMHNLDGVRDCFDDQLTIEHIPPEAFSGKPICLVRKDLNSQAGHSIDKALIEKTNAQLFLQGKAAVKGSLEFNLPELKHVTTEITIHPGETTDIVFDTGEKNFKLFQTRILQKYRWDELKMNMKFSLPGKNQDNRVAFLKYAYLLAFSKVGYALLFGPKSITNPHYHKIRQQIMAPKENIISFVPIFKNVGPRISGLGIVTAPEEMKSLFVTFPLTLKGHTDFFTVFLPAPDDRGFTVYDYIEKERNTCESFDFQFQEVQTFEFWKSREQAIMFHQAWKGLNDN